MNRRPLLRRISRLSQFALTSILGCVALGASTTALADNYPSKNITLIVNGGAGSLPDIFARPIAQKLSTSLGQTVVVDNRPGAGGLVAMQTLVTAPADGYTLAIVTNAHAVWNPYVFPKLPYNPETDLQAISPIAVLPMAIVVNPSLPVNSIAELVALGKKEPGKYNYASSSNGSPPHVLFEMFKTQSGTNFTHVPYKTGPEALTSVITGDTQIYMAGTALVEPTVKNSRLKTLAVSPRVAGNATFEKAPTLAEAGYKGFESAVWLGIVTRTGVPADIVQKLNQEIANALKDPATQALFSSNGSLVFSSSVSDFERRIKTERAEWGPAIEKLGIRPN